MANKFLIKRSSVASKNPATTDLALGELALNTYDGNLFFKKSPSGVDSIVSVVTLDGTQTLTNKTLTSPTINGGALSGTFSGAHTYSGAITLSDTTASTSTTTGALKVGGGLGVAGSIYADKIYAVNNGAGTNFYVGDDVVLGDVNQANTLGIRGQQDASQAYIVFGNANNTNYIGRSGSNPLQVTGQFKVDSGTITGGSAVAMQIAGYANKGGVGYHDFLSVTNGYGSATNATKWLRLNSTGALEIINSAYTANIFTLTDAGVLSVPQISAGGSTGTSGQVLQSTGTGIQWANVGGGTTTNALTIGTGLSGTSFNGSSAVTIAIDSTVATLTGTQTLTNKTIAAGSNTISGLTNSNLSGTAGITNANLANSSVTIGSTAISLGASSTTIAGLTSIDATSGATSFFATPTAPTLFAAGTSISIGAATGTLTINNANTVITGNLTVNGTTTTINSTVTSVDDIEFELGSVASPTDVTANGGGIRLKGTTDKTINWSSIGWSSSEDFNLVTGKSYKINGTSVLNATTLGSAVVTSSLTTVGTIGTGTWQGTIVAGQYGGTGVNNSGKTITIGGNFTHTGAHTLGLTTSANTSVTLPTTGTLATLAGTETLTNKTISFGSNTITTTLAQLNTAITDDDVASVTHKYHSFTNNTYYYDSYQQDRYFRLFTENAQFDNARFAPIGVVEYYDQTSSTWVTWTGGASTIQNLFDGRHESYVDIDHTHRKFRFTITKNSGWPTGCLIGWYWTWFGNGWTPFTTTIEDTTDLVTWTTKETLTFGDGTNTTADYGWHVFYSPNLHNGRTLTRVTVDITNWTDSGGYTAKRLNSFCMFSNYDGAAGTVGVPVTWDYSKTIYTKGNIAYIGSTSGYTTLQASATATGVLTLPSTTDTLVGRATSDTLSNKTLQSAGVAGSLGFNGSTSGTTQLIATAVAGSTTLTLPAATDTLVGKATTDTLTNKTISNGVLTGTLTAGGSVGTSGQILRSTGTGVQWANNSGGSLISLSDVSISTPVANQVLTYTGSVWTNAAPNTVVASAVFAPQAVSDLGYVYDSYIASTENLGLVTESVASIYDMGQLRLDGIVSLSNIDQSVKADYIGYSIIFGF